MYLLDTHLRSADMSQAEPCERYHHHNIRHVALTCESRALFLPIPTPISSTSQPA